MPWKECDRVSSRREFCRLARVEGANVSLLCRKFQISRKTGYKWLMRFREQESDLADRSRRPQHFRAATPAEVERRVGSIYTANIAAGLILHQFARWLR